MGVVLWVMIELDRCRILTSDIRTELAPVQLNSNQLDSSQLLTVQRNVDHPELEATFCQKSIFFFPLAVVLIYVFCVFVLSCTALYWANDGDVFRNCGKGMWIFVLLHVIIILYFIPLILVLSNNEMSKYEMGRICQFAMIMALFALIIIAWCLLFMFKANDLDLHVYDIHWNDLVNNKTCNESLQYHSGSADSPFLINAFISIIVIYAIIAVSGGGTIVLSGGSF